MIKNTILACLKVYFYDNVKANKRCDIPVSRVLAGIKNCAYGDVIEKARACKSVGNEAGYGEIKGKLPAVTFCGTFDKGHKADECNHYNNLLVIDIDKLDEWETDKIRDELEKEPYIAAFWTSPSGKGFKGLVHLEYVRELSGYDIKDKHRLAFKQLFLYLYSSYNIELDKSGSDVCRLCYMSADEHLVIKEEAKPFLVEPDMVAENKIDVKKESNVVTTKRVERKDWNKICGEATDYKDNKQNKNLLLFILKKLRKRNLSITDTWENWVKVAFAIASSVHPEKGRELFLEFCRLDGAKHDEVKSEHLIWDAYCKNQKKCSINSIIYLAGQKGVVLDR